MNNNNKTYTDRNKPFCGWYYDDEQNVFNTSRLLTVSLHANSVPVRVEEETTITHTDAGSGKTYKYTKSKEKFKWYHHNNAELRTDQAKLHYPYGKLDRDDSAEMNKNIVGEDVSGYFIEPLCTCFTSEDFNVTVSNSYQQAGGDVVEQLWNSAKPFAPHVKKLTNMVKTATTTISEQNAELGGNGLIGAGINFIDNQVNNLTEFIDKHNLRNLPGKIEEYLNKSLVLNGARFNYYGGTNLAFSNLGMKFTIFPKWVIGKNGKPALQTVTSQVNEIFPYVMGQYSDFGLPGVLNDKFDGVLGWVTPPGDFRANSSDVDIVQKGTLKLKIGTQYALTNLVIESAQFNFSKEMVKNPAVGYTFKEKDSQFGFSQISSLSSSGVPEMSIGEEQTLTPLFCEVNLQLRPITKYTSQMMERFVKGVYNSYDKDLVISTLNENLDKGNEDMQKRYQTSRSTNLPLGPVNQSYEDIASTPDTFKLD